MKEFISNSENDTFAIAAEVGAKLNAGDTILYTGEMGAGKTAFTKGLAKFFNVDNEVTSPTFALVHEYFGDMDIFHFDLFRISSFDDLYAIGFFDYLDRGGIMAIEWSENISELKSELENIINIDITKTSENGRKITVSGKYFDEVTQ